MVAKDYVADTESFPSIISIHRHLEGPCEATTIPKLALQCGLQTLSSDCTALDPVYSAYRCYVGFDPSQQLL